MPSPGVLIFLCLKAAPVDDADDDDCGPPPEILWCCPGVFDGDGAVDAQWTNSYKERVS